jgi:NADH-quinone oxidoreductase subunit N
VTSGYFELGRVLLPEAALVVGALLVLGIDLVGSRRRSLPQRLRRSALVGLLALTAAVYGAFEAGIGGDAFGGVLILDSLTLATRAGVLVLAALTIACLPRVVRLPHPAEYVAIILFATSGFTLMAAAQQLLIAFLALELASLSLYVLAGFDKSRPESAEAALKYFLFGGVSAAFLLFGFSLIYGLTGSIELPAIAAQLRTQPPSTLMAVALVMILGAFGFKVAAAPFHLWAPDVYQGAPASSAALIASASKLAGFALFLRLLWGGLGPAAGAATGDDAAPGWLSVVAIISAVSLLLGNLAALAQSNVRRLLAYSAIAHAGALLLGILAAGRAGPAPLFYYAATYGLATVGAFAVIAVVERAGRCHDLTDLAGLHRRSPLLAGCLVIFILSLAGIPPLAGFFGKFVVFAAALKLNGLAGAAGWLALLAIAMSAVGLYYYLLILKQAVVLAPVTGAESKIRVPIAATGALLLTAALLVVLGVFPSVVLRLIP